jgi:hypothetical protein
MIAEMNEAGDRVGAERDVLRLVPCDDSFQPSPSEGSRQDPAELFRQRMRELEGRFERLEKTEQDLAIEQDTLTAGFAALQEHVQHTETELAARRIQVEEEISRRLSEAELLSFDLLGGGSVAVPAKEKARCLDLRRRELDAYAAHLRRTEHCLRKLENELGWREIAVNAEEQVLRKERQRWANEQADREQDNQRATSQIAQQTKALAAAQDLLQRMQLDMRGI